MFTGIVQTSASVVAVTDVDGIRRLVVSANEKYLQQLDLGASIAINGCCLTVVHVEHNVVDVVGQVHFDIIDETLKLTNLGELKQGDKVNFERSVTVGTELGGHIVSGHIHDVVIVRDIRYNEANVEFVLAVRPKWLKYVMYKGFVAINGCSLTVGEMCSEGFSLHLIPETLSITNLKDVEIGTKLNLEIDQQTFTIVETTERYLKHREMRHVY